MSTENQPARLRFARAQRFRLTALGLEAATSWRDAVATAQATSGRAAFDAASADWARRFGVEADDAAYVAEFSTQTLRLDELVGALEDTGVSREHVKQVLERLFSKALLEPVTAPS